MDAVRALHIHAQRWLIQKQDLRIVQKRTSDAKPPAHAARIIFHWLIRPRFQIHEPQDFADARFRICALRQIERRVKAQIFPRRKLWIQRRALGQQAYGAAHRFVVTHRIHPQHADRAAVRLVQPTDQMQDRCLARAIRPQQAVDLPSRQLEREIVHPLRLAEDLIHMVQANARLRIHPSHPFLLSFCQRAMQHKLHDHFASALRRHIVRNEKRRLKMPRTRTSSDAANNPASTSARTTPARCAFAKSAASAVRGLFACHRSAARAPADCSGDRSKSSLSMRR